VTVKAQLNLVPDYEVIVCPPQESFRWYTHDYPFHLARWNYHPEYELHLIRSTSGTMMVGDHLGDFGPGNLILTGPNLPHNWVSNIPPGAVVHNRDMLVQFTPDFADKVASLSFEMGGIRGLFDDAVYGVEFAGPTAETGRRLLAEIGAAHGSERVLLFLRLLDALSRDPGDRRRLSRLAPARQAELPSAIDHAMRFLNEAHSEDIDLDAVATRVGMTAQSFSRLFKRQTGHTFASYLVLTRVYATCALLSQTHRPITDICFDVGFNNVANFNRQFLKVCGCTPSEYRRIAHRVGANAAASSPNAPVLAAISGGKV
jgi:AraC-like DNA-binding protein